MISAVILAKNSQDSVESALKSLLWCDEIVIVDDYSLDYTINRIKPFDLRHKNKIKIYKKHLNNDFSAQRNYGLEKAEGDWVLFIDSDEEVSQSLKAEIHSAITNKNIKGYSIRRQDYFMGRWIRFGETGNARFLRLARKSAGIWERSVHEKWHIKGSVADLHFPILHYPHQTITEFLKDINFYSTLHAQVQFSEGKKTNFLKILLKPILKFLKNYLLLLGFLDGLPGLVIALTMSFHSFLTQAKLWQIQQKKTA